MCWLSHFLSMLALFAWSKKKTSVYSPVDMGGLTLLLWSRQKLYAKLLVSCECCIHFWTDEPSLLRYDSRIRATVAAPGGVAAVTAKIEHRKYESFTRQWHKIFFTTPRSGKKIPHCCCCTMQRSQAFVFSMFPDFCSHCWCFHTTAAPSIQTPTSCSPAFQSCYF